MDVACIGAHMQSVVPQPSVVLLCFPEALTVYEYFLSFDAERRVIWGRKLSLPTILFLLNRYLLWLFSLSSVLWNFVGWEENEVSPSG